MRKQGSSTGKPKGPAGSTVPRIKAPSVKVALGYLFKATYAVPALSGYGEHWYLDEDEVETLSEQAEAAIAALPAGKAAAISKFFATWAPVVGFAFAAIAITGARVQETRRLLHVARAGKGGEAGNPLETGSGPVAGNGAAAGGPSGSVKSRSAQLFQTGQ